MRRIALLCLALGLVSLALTQEAPEQAQEEEDVVAKRELNLNTRDSKGQPTTISVHAKVPRGQDAAYGAAVFVFEYKLDAKQVVDIVGFLRQALEEQAPDYESDVEELRTAGAYSKRAQEHSKEDRHMEAAADLTRALIRPGLDPQAKERLEKQLASTIKDHKKMLEEEAKAAKEAAEFEARRRAEEDAEEEARRRKERDEEDWKAFGESLHATRGGGGGGVVTSVSVNLMERLPEGGHKPLPVPLELYHGEDSHDAAVEFCSAYNLHVHKEFANVHEMLKGHLSTLEIPYVPPPVDPNAPALITGAQKKAEEGYFASAGADYSRALEVGGLDEQMEGQVQSNLVLMLRLRDMFEKARETFEEQKWEEALQHLHRIQKEVPVSKNARVLLMQARCNQQLGRWTEVVRIAGTLLQNTATRGSWVRGQPRMVAVSVGAQAAMEMGDSEKTLKFYQLVLRNDPDQREVDVQYKGLKKIVKLLKEGDDMLKQSKNHKALEALNEALSAMKGMDVSSGMFRTNILLRVCTANSELKRHEEALLACDQCVQKREQPVAGMFVDPRKLSEALAARAQAHVNDHNYDEAVRDFRAAQEHAANSGRQEEAQRLEMKLREASMQKRQWAERRDHRMVLELPVNLHQLPQDKQCNWIKKQHKALARKWHPDKAKGDKARASRKMREVSEAKEVLYEQLKC